MSMSIMKLTGNCSYQFRSAYEKSYILKLTYVLRLSERLRQSGEGKIITKSENGLNVSFTDSFHYT